MKKKLYNEMLYRFCVVGGALFIALLLGAVLFAVAGANPLKAYAVMFTEPLGSMFGITEMLVRAAPLMLVALGIAISFRCGIFNIGGEGQILIGAIMGAATALAFPGLPSYLLIPLVFIVSFIGGALWGSIAGYMKAYLGVDEILSTVMLNYIAFQVYTYLIRGPLIDSKEVVYGTGVPQTALLTRDVWLSRIIPATRLHTGFLFAIVMAVIVFFLLWKTTYGYRMRAVGAEQKGARYAGINVKKYLVIAMVMAGGFAGMAGAVEVTGVHHRAMESLSAGYGFSGIVVALFGGLHPLGIIPASIVFGLLILGADMMQRAVDVPAAIILAIQGLIIMSIVSTQIFLMNKKMKEKLIKRFTVRKPGKTELATEV